MTQSIFVQIGATRDGLDPYLSAAHARGLTAWLIETPEYLAYRAGLSGRQRFDREVGVATPADPRQVASALESAGARPRLVLAGFDRYVAAAHWLDGLFGNRTVLLHPYDKFEQRRALARLFPEQAQPTFAAVDDLGDLVREFGRIGGEVVVKPVEGAGGLGVYRVASRAAAQDVVARLEGLRNYDGSRFAGVLVERLIPGTEYSIQGIARDGQPELLSICEKVIGSEVDVGAPHLCGFRELAHIATPGMGAAPEFAALAQRCLTAFDYRDGPFQIDLIRSAEDGKLYFLELGYRLSGVGLVGLIEQLTGLNWGDVAFGWALDREWSTAPDQFRRCVGQCLLRSPAELARAAGFKGHDVTVQTERFATVRADFGASVADALRHAGFLGRARVCGHTAGVVGGAVRFMLGTEGGLTCAG